MYDKFYPWANSLSKNVSINLATLGVIGKLKAPGTWGSLAGVGLYLILFRYLSAPIYIIACIALAYAAMGICDAAERHLKMKDPGMIVLDEFIAIPICFMPISLMAACNSFWFVLFGFCIFRFFDIVKPLGIKNIQKIEGGVGCVIDDIAAALCTFAVLILTRAVDVIANLQTQ